MITNLSQLYQIMKIIINLVKFFLIIILFWIIENENKYKLFESNIIQNNNFHKCLYIIYKYFF